MNKLFYKERKLAASPLSYFFLVGTLLTFVPGYPILFAAFFVTLGLFYSFQTTRENHDIAYSLLLPIAKADIVKGKFAFAVSIELAAFLAMTVFTLLRMLFFRDAAVYTSNVLMCANLAFLGFGLLLFGLFNLLFLGGFFKTAYYFGKPFIAYGIVSLLVITAAETLHHLPGLEALNAFGFAPLLPQGAVLLAGILFFVLLTVLAYQKSKKCFEMLDL